MLETAGLGRHQLLVQQSVESILRNQEPNGALVAARDFAEYQFCWLRDGSFSAYALDMVGEREASSRFHAWVAAAVGNIGPLIDDAVASHARRDLLDPIQMPPARFTLGGTVVIDGWPNFQIDGYGTWLWSLEEHLRLNPSSVLLDGEHESVLRVGRYLSSFALSPCFDVWEESGSAVHTSTMACVYGGLRAAARLTGEVEFVDAAVSVKEQLFASAATTGYFQKSSESGDVDASTLWLGSPFNVVSVGDALFDQTVALIEERLTFLGGIRRYPSDTYFGSGAWPVLTASLGLHHLRAGNLSAARRCRDWVADQIDAGGHLGEQYGGQLRDPAHYSEWVERWGLPARDLTWSHAMYVILTTAIERDESEGVASDVTS